MTTKNGKGAFVQGKAGLSYDMGNGLYLDGDVLFNYGSGGDRSVGAKIGVRYTW